MPPVPPNAPNPGDSLREAISGLIEILKQNSAGQSVIRPALGQVTGGALGTAFQNTPFLSKFFKEVKESADALKNFRQQVTDYKKFSTSTPLGPQGLQNLAQSVAANPYASVKDKRSVLNQINAAGFYAQRADRLEKLSEQSEEHKKKVSNQYFDLKEKQKQYALEKDKLNRQAARQQTHLGKVMGIYTTALARVSLYKGPRQNSPHYQQMVAAKRKADQIQASIKQKLSRARQAGQAARALNPQIKSAGLQRAAARINAARAAANARAARGLARSSAGTASMAAGQLAAKASLVAFGAAIIRAGSTFSTFALILNEAANSARNFAHNINENNRRFGAFSPQTGVAFAQLAFGDMRRFIHTAVATSATASNLANAVNRMNDKNQLLGISQLNIGNRLALSAAGFAGGFAGPKGEAFHSLDSLIGSLQNANIFGFKSHEDLMDRIGKGLSDVIFTPIILALNSLERTINWETKEEQEARRAKELKDAQDKAALGGPAEQFIKGMLGVNAQRQGNVRNQKLRDQRRGVERGFGFGD